MPDGLKDAVTALETAKRAEIEAKSALEAAEDRLFEGAIGRREFSEIYEVYAEACNERRTAERAVARAHAEVA